MRPLLALVGLLLLAGCARPGEGGAAEGAFEPIEFEHDFTEGALGNAPFPVPEGAGTLLLEMWYAPLEPTGATCDPGTPPVTMRLLTPEDAADESLTASADCPELKRARADMAAGDWALEFSGQAPIVGRFRLAPE